jgi:RNA polymerase sigma-70 factor (ECF subfamily)
VPARGASSTLAGRPDVRAERLLSASSTDVLRYLQRRTQQPEDAADLLSDAMLVVWRRRSNVPLDATQARMWFFGIARTLLRGYHSGKTRQEELATALRDQLRTANATAVRDGSSAVAQDPDANNVRALIAKLAPKDREIVTLVHWDGFKLAEVAVMLKMPSATVRSRYLRARARLRAELTLDAEL